MTDLLVYSNQFGEIEGKPALSLKDCGDQGSRWEREMGQQPQREQAMTVQVNNSELVADHNNKGIWSTCKKWSNVFPPNRN